ILSHSMSPLILKRGDPSRRRDNDYDVLVNGMVVGASAQENSNFIESVRAIQSLKLFNRETEREGQWLNRYAEVASANVRLGRAKIAFSTINDLIFGLETIVIIYLAARLVLGNQLTVGMVSRSWLTGSTSSTSRSRSWRRRSTSAYWAFISNDSPTLR